METLEAIATRRSIRRFETGRALDPGQLDTLLRAAMAAPSAGNQRPWRFVTVTDRAMLDMLSAATPYAAPLESAAVGIVVVMDTAEGKYPGHAPQDCGAAIENLLLAATALGLGAVWLGVYPTEESVAKVGALVGVPDGLTTFAMIAVGHPERPGPFVDRYEPAWVHSERW